MILKEKIVRLQQNVLAALASAPVLLWTWTPVVGQDAPPRSSADVAASSSAAIPDFSGVWGHLSLPPLEPPINGPGPVLPKVSITGFRRLVGDDANPILKPHAAEAVKQHGDIELSGRVAPNPGNQCWPGGVPFVFWNLGMQMLQQRDQIVVLYSNDHEVRHIRMNAQHPAQLKPSWYGDSVGHYQGDTLVIDTVGIKVGPYAMVDFFGTPHTEALHVVERYRLLDNQTATAQQARGERTNWRLPAGDPGFGQNPNDTGPGLQLHITVEDDGVFTTPWTAIVTYRRPLLPLGQWPEFVCADNPHVYYGGVDTAVPQADKPDF
jgi:hypothetical protein